MITGIVIAMQQGRKYGSAIALLRLLLSQEQVGYTRCWKLFLFYFVVFHTTHGLFHAIPTIEQQAHLHVRVCFIRSRFHIMVHQLGCLFYCQDNRLYIRMPRMPCVGVTFDWRFVGDKWPQLSLSAASGSILHSMVHVELPQAYRTKARSAQCLRYISCIQRSCVLYRTCVPSYVWWRNLMVKKAVLLFQQLRLLIDCFRPPRGADCQLLDASQCSTSRVRHACVPYGNIYTSFFPSIECTYTIVKAVEHVSSMVACVPFRGTYGYPLFFQLEQ